VNILHLHILKTLRRYVYDNSNTHLTIATHICCNTLHWYIWNMYYTDTNKIHYTDLHDKISTHLHMNESCVTYEWVMSYIWMGHVIPIKYITLKYMTKSAHICWNTLHYIYIHSIIPSNKYIHICSILSKNIYLYIYTWHFPKKKKCQGILP